MPVRPPSGTVTFLFTGIQDFLRRWDEAPAEMAAAQRVHDRIVREAIEGHGGHVFATDGDGFRAAFATAASAAEAAVEAQRTLRADTTIGFAVRMGLHTGETVERDGDYSGSEVNRAARLTALAHGGQVLVSDTAEMLLRNRLSLRPLGEHVLRGLRGRISVYQVVADGLRTGFPVLRSAEQIAGNLPRQVTSLVGRDDQVRHGAERRARPATGHAHRRRRGRQDADGVRGRRRARWGLPRWSVARRAGGGRRSGVDPRRHRDGARDHAAGRHSADHTVAATLAAKRLLLVVDNCEHVLKAAGSAIEMIVGRSGNVRVLATSREALGVDGETVLDVSPLAVAGGTSPTPSRCSSTGRVPCVTTSGSATRTRRRP